MQWVALAGKSFHRLNQSFIGGLEIVLFLKDTGVAQVPGRRMGEAEFDHLPSLQGVRQMAACFSNPGMVCKQSDLIGKKALAIN